MLEAGEDAPFIARRLVILASEDIGMADPMSLLIADAAARAVDLLGYPRPNSTFSSGYSSSNRTKNRTQRYLA